MFDAAWFFSCYPVFNSVDNDVVEKQIAFAEAEVCWAKRCGKYERALALQTALFLHDLGYPLENGQTAPSPGSNDYDQVIKKHQVGDVVTEFQVIDKKASGIGGADYAGQLKKLKISCVGTLTNTHVMAGRGIRGTGCCGC